MADFEAFAVDLRRYADEQGRAPPADFTIPAWMHQRPRLATSLDR